jgi:hypothetical protein
LLTLIFQLQGIKMSWHSNNIKSTWYLSLRRYKIDNYLLYQDTKILSIGAWSTSLSRIKKNVYLRVWKKLNPELSLGGYSKTVFKLSKNYLKYLIYPVLASELILLKKFKPRCQSSRKLICQKFVTLFIPKKKVTN